MKVIKRDGSTVDFDRSKIVVAIQKANNAVDESERIAEDRIENIAHYVESRNRMRLLVEDIQDMVEHQLMQEGKFDLAKAYIILPLIPMRWCARQTLRTKAFCL